MTVSGLNDSIDESVLVMHFESKKGGLLDVESIEMDPNYGTAVVSFTDDKCKL